MSAIVEFPQVVGDELERFADLFANAPQRRHFAEYLTGLIVAGNKTVAVRPSSGELRGVRPASRSSRCSNHIRSAAWPLGSSAILPKWQSSLRTLFAQ